jgi:hypothetical protein
MIADAHTGVFLNGLVEGKIVQKEETVYDFEYMGEGHKVAITKADEAFVDIVVESTPQAVRIDLLETMYLDIDGDGEDDISLTYMGLEGDEVDVRIRMLPQKPKTIIESTQSFSIGIGERTPMPEKPEVIEKEPPWRAAKSFVGKWMFRIIIGGLILFLLFMIVLLFINLFDKVKKRENKEEIIKKDNKEVKIKKQ